MNLKKCIFTANDCYKANEQMAGGKPTGIVVHSTGANNKYLKRYVQPLTSYPDYEKIIADIGFNVYSNHWNRSAEAIGRSVCVHAFIGANLDGKVETYQTLPFDICCWGVGKGQKGSYNYNPHARVQFEICEDALDDRAYFDAAFKEAIEFCAYLCKLYGFGVDKISSHRESHLAGYGENHGDCDHWLAKFGLDMDWFRAEVAKLLNEQPKEVETDVIHRVWVGHFEVKVLAGKQLLKLKKAGFNTYLVLADGYYAIQIGAYRNKDLAEGVLNKALEAGFSAYITTEGGKTVAQVTRLADQIKVGDTVRVAQGAKTYTGVKLASFVYGRNHVVSELRGDRAVITYNGVVVAAVKVSDLTLV